MSAKLLVNNYPISTFGWLLTSFLSPTVSTFLYKFSYGFDKDGKTIQGRRGGMHTVWWRMKEESDTKSSEEKYWRKESKITDCQERWKAMVSERGGGRSLFCSDLEKGGSNFVLPSGYLILLLLDTSGMGWILNTVTQQDTEKWLAWSNLSFNVGRATQSCFISLRITLSYTTSVV